MIDGYRNNKSSGKCYTLRKNGRIIFVGTVSEISSHFDIEPRNIYNMLNKDGCIFGMEAKETIMGEKVTHADTMKYEPKKYKDSHSARFTPL